jgi:hypothetical protein
MGQFSRTETEKINHVVLDCSIRRFTVYETQAYIKEHLLSYPTVRNYRRRQRDSAQQWIANLAKSKRASYIACYRERIEEVEIIQRKLWEMINNPHIGPGTRVNAAETLLKCTEQLIQLYDCLPLVNAIRDYGCGYDHDYDHNQDSLPLYPSSSSSSSLPSPLSHIPRSPCLTRRPLYDSDDKDKDRDKDNNSGFSDNDNDSDNDSHNDNDSEDN